MFKAMRGFAAKLFLGLLLTLPLAQAAPVLITVNTQLLAGSSAQLAFDLIDGGAPANSVSISGFATNGTLGAASTSGGASGSLGTTVSLTDSSFFNEYLQNIVLGTTLSFIYNTSDLGPAAGSLPDGFSFFLLNPAGLPLVSTTDPTGSDALFLYNIGSPLGLSVYQSASVIVTAGPVTNGVPEPGSLLLVVSALLLLAVAGRFAAYGRRFAAALAGLLCLLAAPAWAADVSDRITVTTSGFVYNRATSTYDTTATLKNVSTGPVSSPVTLEVASISAASVSLANSAGNNANGRPFVNIAGDMAPGAQKTALLKFANPQRAAFSITTRVFGTLPSVNALPEVVAAPKQFFVNTPTQVRFQSQIPPSALLDAQSVKLFRADAGGNPTGAALCALLDNGKLVNGDDVAADNVYSCFATFNSAAPETVRLVVSASIGGSAALSPVIALDIVATLDPSVAQQIINAQAQAVVLANQAIAALGDNLAARQSAVAGILQLAGVQSAGVSSDNTTIWIHYTSGIDGGVMLNPPGTRGSSEQAVVADTATRRPSFASRVDARQSAEPAAFPLMRPLQRSLGNTLKSALGATAEAQSFVGNTNVLIWDAYNSQFAPFDEGPGLQTLFQGSQCPLYNVTYLKDAQATVASVKSFTNYGTIILVTHGAVDGNGQVVFLTRETASLGAMLSNAIDLILGRVIIMGNVFAIRPSFIGALPGAMADSVVYNGSCQSSANSTMSDAFVAKGAKTYYGYTRVVNSDFAQSSATQLFTPMVSSFKTTGDSFTAVVPKVDPTGPNATFTQAGDALLAYTGDLQNGNFEKGNLASWVATGDGRVVTGLGPFAPTEGVYAGLISTGLGFTTSSGSIAQNFCLPKTATKLTFDWNFSSEEFIEYCGSQFDDRFQVVLETSTGSTTLFQTSVNSLCLAAIAPTPLAFDQSGPGCVPTPANVGYGTGGNDCKVWSKGWTSQQIDISGLAATNDGKGVKLRFFASDVGDSIFDSAILLDKIVVVRP